MKLIIISFSILAMALFLSCSERPKVEQVELNNWKLKSGDSLKWANPEYNVSTWGPIQVGRLWDAQGYGDYDGYAWYRTSFRLTSDLKNGAFFKDSLQILLGRIDDCDQTFLNGKSLGQNGKLLPFTETASLNDLTQLKSAWNVPRDYTVSVNDPRLIWDGENTLAVRVYDFFRQSGMYTLPVNVSMKDLNDYLVFDVNSDALVIKEDGTMSKAITLKNLSPKPEINGILKMEIRDCDSKQVITTEKYNIGLTNEGATFSIQFKGDLTKRLSASYTFTESKTNASVSHMQEFPYILTPKPTEKPKINGAKIIGVRPCSPFLFRIPTTGVRPIAFSAENLPLGLSVDAKSGVISGNISQAGEYRVSLKAKNEKGEATRELQIVVGQQLCLTPPMGWNSWNSLGHTVDEQKVRANADIFISSGLADHGWTYINLDEGWTPRKRTNGKLICDKFSDMKALTDHIHSFGLKAGIYSTPGPESCNDGYPGSFSYEEIDARTFADWGFDYLKYDWCSYDAVAKDHSLPELQKPFVIMKEALDRTGRDFVYSLCQYGMGEVWKWGDAVGGNLWRTVGDVFDTWESMSGSGFNQEAGAPFQKPGNWNDPDMLVVGTGWFGGENMHPSRLTPNEQYTQISLWSLLSAPLLIGCDLTRLDDFTLNLLTNDEVIAIDQDPLGKAALPGVKNENYVIMVKDMEDGSKAVGLFNLTENDLKITAPWSALKLSGKQNVRDVWQQKDLGTFSDKFESMVPRHGVVLVKIGKQIEI